MRSIVPLVSAAALAAAPVAPIAAQVRSDTAKAYSDRLKALTDVQRRGALRGAIIDSGEKCGAVTKAAYQGVYKNLEMWVARCSNNQTYGAFIGPDATVQVSSCPYLVSVHWPACRRLD
jgi:hypothetical protein